MILPVYIYGQPVLRKEAEDITPDYPNLKELIENMFETMDRADGCGLAWRRTEWLSKDNMIPSRVYNFHAKLLKEQLLTPKSLR